MLFAQSSPKSLLTKQYSTVCMVPSQSWLNGSMSCSDNHEGLIHNCCTAWGHSCQEKSHLKCQFALFLAASIIELQVGINFRFGSFTIIWFLFLVEIVVIVFLDQSTIFTEFTFLGHDRHLPKTRD